MYAQATDSMSVKGRVHVFGEDERYRKFDQCELALLPAQLKEGWTVVKDAHGLVKRTPEGLIEVTKAPIVYDCRHGNLIVRQGRKDILKAPFNMNSPTWTAPNTYGFGGVGSGTTAAAITDTQLGTELTGNANRITITDTSGNPFADSDVIQHTSGSDDQQLTVQWVYPSSDGNNGSVFAEYGVFTTSAFSTHVMFAHFVPSSSITKGSFSVTCQWTYSS